MSEAAADAIASFRDDGSNVRAKICTHYTALDESAYKVREVGNAALMVPPLRTSSDVDTLFEHLPDRTLSIVSTDHVPQKRARKTESAWWEVYSV